MAGRTYIIGRRGEITLNDDTVSGRHAELTVLDGSFFLTDLGSTNGTWQLVNGQRQPFIRGPVLAGQEFAFGNCVRSVRQLVDAVEAIGAGGQGHAIAGTVGGSPSPLAAEADGERRRCRGCGAVIMASELHCPVCQRLA